MYIHQLVAHFAHQVQCNRRIVDECTRFSVAANFASQNGFVGIEVDVVVGKERVERIFWQTERSFDDAFFLALLYLFAVGSVA